MNAAKGTRYLFAALLLAAASGPAFAASTIISSGTVQGDGFGPWINPGNILSADSMYASYTGTTRDPNTAKGFGFSINPFAVIQGIKAFFKGYGAGGTVTQRQFEAALTKDGATQATAFTPVTFNSSDSTVFTGGEANLWVVGWTPVEISSPAFGVIVRDYDTNASELRFDWAGLQVFYYISTPTVTAVSPGGATLSWAPVSTEKGYLVEASTAADFSGTILSSQTSSAQVSTLTVSGLLSNTTYSLRLGALFNNGTTSYASVIATATAIEPPTSIYFDEISTWSVTAAAYAASFTGMERGLSGVAITTAAHYVGWTAGGNAWAARFDSSQALNNQAAAALGGKLYVFGGTPDGVAYSAANNAYDPVSNSWQTRAALGSGRSLLAGAVAGGKIYALGGLNSGGIRDLNEEYDPVVNSWNTRKPMPAARERHAAVALEGKIFVIGGNNAGAKGNVYVYNPATNSWTEKASLSNPKERVSAGAVNGKIYIAGGFDIGYLNTVEEYDPAGNSWSAKSPMPTSRAGAAAGVIGGKLYVAAGYNNGGNLSVNEAYDPATNSWATKAPALTAREGVAYGVLKGRLYVVTGNNGPYLKTTEAYDPGVSMHFQPLQPNQSYTFKARARNLNGIETGEVLISTYTLAIATMPAAGNPLTVISPHDVEVRWSTGSQAGGYNGPGARYLVQASTAMDFSGEIKFQTTWEQDHNTISWLEPKTTYYFRVQAYNYASVTDYSWTVLGSTRTDARPLGGAIISTMAWTEDNFNWSRNMARDSNGNLYAVYLKDYGGKYRIFLASSSDNGDNWASTPAPIDGADSMHDRLYPALAMDSQDQLHVIWGQTGDPGPFYSYASAAAQSWSVPAELPALEYAEGQLNIAVDSNDGLHAVWSGLENIGPGYSRVRYSSRTALGNWTAPQNISDDGVSAEAPALAVDANDGVHVLIKHAVMGGTDNAPQIAYSSRSAAAAWGAWGNVYTDPNGFSQSRPALTIASNGNLFAAWSSADATYVNNQVKYSLAPPGGPWSAMAYVGAEPSAPQREPSAAADAVGNVFVLWSGSDTVNPAVNLKGSVYNGSVWDNIEGLTDEESMSQIYPAVRWAGWRNNGGGIDIIWNTWDGLSSTATLRVMQGPDVPMSPGWSKTAWAVPADCGYAINVRQAGGGDFASIQQGVNAVPTELSTATCVVIRDAYTYSEQVTVQGIKTGRWDEGTSYRLIIMKDPTFISSGPVVSPPHLSTAAFHIMNDSVTVQGITVAPQNAVSYGILASSAGVSISGVDVISGGKITTAGLAVSSYSAVEFSSVTVESGKGIWVTGINNSVFQSSAVCSGGGASALYLSGSSSNTVSWSYFSSPAGYGVNLYYNNHFNTVTQSTITANTISYYALSLVSSSSNSIDGNYIYNGAGYGANLTSSDNNSISRSSVTGNSASGSALRFSGSSSNILSESYVQAPLGYALSFAAGSNYNTVNLSTITAAAGSQPALYISESATNTIASSYIQGSTAAAVSSVNGVTIIRGSVLKGIASNGVGLSLASSQGLFMTSSTFSGGSGGPALYLGALNTGKIELASNTVNGGGYGLNIGALGAGGSLVVSSLTFQSLTAGATAINFIGGSLTAEMEAVNFESDNIAVNVNAGGLMLGSNIFFAHPKGRWGALYENDPAGYINWPGMEAVLIGPPDEASGVSPAAALHALLDGGNLYAQYQFQVDTAETMDSQGVELPLHNFDQTGAQSYVNWGAFSGQDHTVSVANDAYVYNSTATFVFYSTGTQLSPNTLHYWRARVKTPESGAYGNWTSTYSFITGQMAAAFPSPVNNLAVTGVALSSPSADGVSISFTLRENNVVSSQTANGANYNTADWIFVKFSTAAGADGTWNHATLTGGQVGNGATLAAASDNKGVFINHTQNAAYWTAPATVTWNYGADGVTGGNAVVKVFAISVVKVPDGQFVYNAGGIGGSDYNNYGGGAQANVTSEADRPTGAPIGWPNGYSGFYLMRYEITQGQYADFLNAVHSSTAAARYASNSGYGHQMSNAGTYPNQYSAVDRFAAKNYLSTADLWSYLSWAALRPMTEMEFEKAARDVGGDARTYPWGNTVPDTSTYNPRNEGGTATRNFMNFNGSSGKVLDVGRYMSGDVYRTAEQTGASPYGIADLGGNVWEHILNCSYLSVPANGNGSVAWPAGWPAADSSQKGLRGGDWGNVESYAPVSFRLNASGTGTYRDDYIGGRGGRTP